MSALNICLVLLTFAFWGGNLAYYFRGQIYRWLDNRVRHEPLTDRVRLWFSPGQK